MQSERSSEPNRMTRRRAPQAIPGGDLVAVIRERAERLRIRATEVSISHTADVAAAVVALLTDE